MTSFYKIIAFVIDKRCHYGVTAHYKMKIGLLRSEKKLVFLPDPRLFSFEKLAIYRCRLVIVTYFVYFDPAHESKEHGCIFRVKEFRHACLYPNLALLLKV